MEIEPCDLLCMANGAPTVHLLVSKLYLSTTLNDNLILNDNLLAVEVVAANREDLVLV
jgi:hypothetical protein